MKKNNKSLNKSLINRLSNLIQKNTDSLYKNTYFSNSDNSKDLNIIKKDISNSIDNIMDNNVNNLGIPNISKFYTRIMNKKENNNIDDVFNDQAITDGLLLSFNENKYIVDYDKEIDLICKYMPSLQDAIDARKDNVLSADHFSKDFINIINKSNLDGSNEFNTKIKFIKKKYNLLEFFENIYDDTIKYGESYVYICPYSKAFNKLLSYNNNIMNESFEYKDKLNKNKISSLNVSIDKTGIISSFAEQYKNCKKSINEAKFEKIIDNNLKFEIHDNNKNDGFININKQNNNNKVNVPGCIVKRLKRENIIPLYIDEMCLGYYYLEIDNSNMNSFFDYGNDIISNNNSSYFNKIKNISKTTNNINNTLKELSKKISKYIDKSFITANQDLSKEIYYILKYNNFFKDSSCDIKITFLPPDDITHVYLSKNSTTHRGISSLENSLIPAKLFICLYVTNTLGILTRSHDKRVYYVKQTIDTNISKTLLNTILQIKKSNFGARELNNLKNVLNLSGRYNDLIIPVGSSGESPINFEVMQGQQIEVNQELLDLLEQMAVNATDVPYEYIQSRKNVDYAVRLTMSSGKFLRKVFKDQSKIEIFFSDIINKIYNYEYNNNDILELQLPPPAFLNILNSNQMLENVDQYVNSIIEMEMPNSDDTELVSKFRCKLKRYFLGTYLDLDRISALKKESEMELNKEKTGKDE